MRQLALIGSVLAALALLLLWRSGVVGRAGAPHVPPSSEVQVEKTLEGRDLGDSATGGDSKVELDTSQLPVREAHDGTGLQVFLTSEDGDPLEGVEGVWSPTPDSSIASDLILLQSRRDELLSRQTSSRSDSTGRLEFDLAASPESQAESTLAVHSAAYGLHWFQVGESLQMGPLTLAKSTPLRIRVSRADGASAEGAVVHVLARGAPMPLEGASEVPSSLLALTLSPSPAGEARLGRFDGEALILAELGDECSPPWIGNPSAVEKIELQLGSTLRASGDLIPVGDFSLADLDLDVRAFHRTEEGESAIHSVEVAAEPRWSMERLPTFVAGEYVFRLEGQEVVPSEAVVSASRRAPIHADLEVRVGASFEVRVRDHDQNPLEAVDVGVRWEGERARVLASSTTNKEGAAQVAGVLPGEVWITISRKGFVSSTWGPFATGPLVQAGADLYLARAGALRVSCTRNGEPLGEYTLRYWEGPPHKTFEKEVVADDLGGFTLEDAPLGNVHIFAFDEESPASAIATVPVSEGEVSEVELELPSAGRAGGSVVDSSTGLPVSDAMVQVLAMFGTQPVGPTSPAVAVDASGRFQALAIPRVPCWLDVRAPGYSTNIVRCEPDSTGGFDAGEIELASGGTLEVRLIGSSDSDLTKYQVDLKGIDQSPRIACDAQGRAVFEGVSPGSPILSIWPNDYSRHGIELDLKPGGDWSIEVPLETDRRATVRVIPASGESLEEGMFVGATWTTSDGFRSVFHRPVLEGGRVEFENLTGDQAVFDVWSSDFRTLAVARATLPQSGDAEVEIQVEKTPRRIQFLDKNFDPVVGAKIDLNLEGDDTCWLHSLTTDNEGIVETFGLHHEQVTALVRQGNANAFTGVIEFEPDPEELTIVPVDTSASLRLRVLDGELALDDAQAGLGEREGILTFEVLDADPSGIVQFGPLSPRTYHAEVFGEGLWTTFLSVEAGPDNPEYEVQVRRMGSLELLATRAGEPLESLQLELVALEFDQLASDWVRAGRIRSTTGDMRTDSSGRLVLIGLPHGKYSCQSTSPEGGIAETAIVVAPAELTRVTLEP